MNRTLAMILAGGQGSRLMPLTRDRAKPAVPFGGRYRIVDFVLSNFVNSGFHRIVVVTQYKSQSLTAHLSRGWRLSRILDQFVEAVPAQQRTGTEWYKGSADAVFQNLNLISDENPNDVAIFGGDHIYKMDVREMYRDHREVGADLTISAIPVPIEQATAFGVIEIDEKWRMIGFEEKPKNPKPIPGRSDRALVSMGNYFFRTRVLLDAIERDAVIEHSVHDFGRNVIPDLLARGHLIKIYDFSANRVPGQSDREAGYWRDVGSIESFYNASMDLIAPLPVVDLYNRQWPVRTDSAQDPPAKFVHAAGERVGIATESMVCEGCIISGGRISRSILSPRVRVNSYSLVEDCILFEDVHVGRNAKLRKAIVDKDVVIPPSTEIGYDHEKDKKRGLTVTAEGIVVVPKRFQFA